MTARTEFATAYPLPVSQAFAGGRAILTRDTVQIPDTQADPGFAWGHQCLAPFGIGGSAHGRADGAIGQVAPRQARFAAQVELLKTLAERAVIAMGSADVSRFAERTSTR
jgi:hypothetical protein